MIIQVEKDTYLWTSFCIFQFFFVQMVQKYVLH